MELLSLIIVSHKQFVTNTMAFLPPISVNIKDKLPLFHQLKKFHVKSCRSCIYSVSFTNLKVSVDIIYHTDLLIFRKYIQNTYVIKFFSTPPSTFTPETVIVHGKVITNGKCIISTHINLCKALTHTTVSNFPLPLSLP